MLNTIEGIDNLSLASVPERALINTLQQLDNTLNNLKLNHPKITEEDMNLIKTWINASLRDQIKVDKKECEREMQGYNPYTIKTGGMKRNFMELITSERHAIGNYKRCAYEYEQMDSVIHKLDKLGPESELNHNKLQLLKSYTKHYQRFKKDLDILNKFGPEKLKKEFESSKDMDGRTGQWRDNLELWRTANHPPPPARIRNQYNIHDP